jgi:hypothetical protein
MPFLTDAQKSAAQLMLETAPDTFKEPLYIFQTPTQTVVAKNANYIWAFGNNQPEITVENVTNSGVYWGTVEYMDSESLQRIPFPAGSELAKKEGLVRISVSGQLAYEALLGSEKIVFDGQNFQRARDIFPRGLFTRTFFDVWLFKID